jgi:hypothetical protein
MKQCDIGVRLEWMTPGEQLIQEDAERKDVAASVERPAGRLLWRHVRDRPGSCA